MNKKIAKPCYNSTISHIIIIALCTVFVNDYSEINLYIY